MGRVALPSALRPSKPVWAGPGALAALILLAVAFAYSPALRGGMLWDDDAHVTRPELQALHGLWRIWFDVGATQQYYPVLHSAFWIEHRVWGGSVLGYHAANIAFHAAAAWLLVLILRRLSFPAPGLAGLVFALHPVCVESVAWISEQKNTLSAVFYLGSALLYLRFDASRRRAWYAGAFLLFAAALLTKSVTATLPAALLVVIWWRRGLEWRRDAVPLLPWIAVGAASGLFTAWAEARLIGAEGADFSLTVLQRLLLAARAVWFYLGKLVWPANLMFIYPRWRIDPGQVRLWLGLLGLLVLGWALAYVARSRRGPLAGFLVFVGTLFPVLGFVNVYPFLFSFVADHFQYLASLGVLVPAAWALRWVSVRLPVGAKARACLPLAVLGVLGTLTWRRCGNYRDSEGLYRATLARNRSAWLMHYNLAVVLGASPGRLPEAIAEYEETLKLKPDHWAARSNLASALLKEPGRTAEAVAQYEAAIRINPGFPEAHNDLAVALGRMPGRYREALAEVRIALRLRPDYDGAHDNLGVLLMREPGTLGEAIGEFEAAIRIDPGVAEYHYNLANALSMRPDRLEGAVSEYRAALSLKPDSAEAHSNLGAALSLMPGRLPEAVAQFEAALRLAPDNAKIHSNLANALARIPGRGAEAVAEYEASLRMDPSDPAVHNALGVLLSDMPGRLPDAVAQFESAVKLDPQSAAAQFCLGIGLARSGRRGEAEEHLQRSLEIRPDFEPARRALERLRSEGR